MRSRAQRNARPPERNPAGKSSFADKLAQALLSQSHTGQSVDPDAVLLLDLSGSMWEWAGAGKTKLEALADLVARLPPARRFGFSGDCQEIDHQAAIDQVAGQFGGTTDLERAFATVRAAGAKTVVLITDGHPTSGEPETLQAAGGLQLHIFYVGPEPVPDFLKALAKATDGQFHRGNLSVPLAIETKIRGLLAGPSGRGPIQL